MAGLRAYPLPKRRRITIEYTLVAGKNDTKEEARKLVRLLRGLPVKINLIPMNPIDASALGPPEGRIVDALIAGDHVVATDAAMMRLMGHDPRADWPAPPFHRDRNPLLVAAEGGFGTVDLGEVDYSSEVAPQPPGSFYAIMTDAPEVTASWRRTMSEQALFYRDNPGRFERYAGEYILLQDGEVRWHDPRGTITVSRRQLAGDHPDHALFYKYVDPAEAEGERYAVYERTLAAMLQR